MEKLEYLGIGGVALASAFMFQGCVNKELKEGVNSATEQTNQKVKNILTEKNSSYENNYFLNPITQKKFPYINFKTILYPIGLEKNQKIDGEISLDAKNYYKNGESKNYYSNLKEKIETEIYPMFEDKRSNIISDSYEKTSKRKIEIISGASIGKSTPEGNKSENDYGILNLTQNSINLNKSINSKRAEEILNLFVNDIGRHSEIKGLENIEIISEIVPFSDEEIGILYNIALKYSDKMEKGEEYDAIMNLIKIYNKNPEVLEQEDKTILFRIIDEKRTSNLKIKYKGEGLNSDVTYSYLNLFVILLYSLILIHIGTKKRIRK